MVYDTHPRRRISSDLKFRNKIFISKCTKMCLVARVCPELLAKYTVLHQTPPPACLGGEIGDAEEEVRGDEKVEKRGGLDGMGKRETETGREEERNENEEGWERMGRRKEGSSPPIRKSFQHHCRLAG